MRYDKSVCDTLALCVNRNLISFTNLCYLITRGPGSVRASTHWRQSRKDVRHSGDKSYPLLTKSTEVNMFNFGDNVDGDKSATK